MARDPEAPSRVEILVLSTLSRTPLHGYDLKLELRYKHVRWWAKCEHGHLYATLERLARRGHIRLVPRAATRRRVYTITAAGRRRLERSLQALCDAEDTTWFDIDVFLAAAFVLERERALSLLDERQRRLQEQLRQARALHREMLPHVPAVGRLIIEHRIEHLGREIRFVEKAREAIAAEERWGPFLGEQSISEFVKERGVPVESD